MITSRSLDDLNPLVRHLAQRHIEECKKVGIDLLIYCTYRDNEAQNDLYSQGRTKPGSIVTNARGGDSAHNYRIAYDCVPLVNGKTAWSDTILYKKVAEIGKKLGLEWAGDWKSFKEFPHFQYTGGLTIAELKAGKQIPSALV